MRGRGLKKTMATRHAQAGAQLGFCLDSLPPVAAAIVEDRPPATPPAARDGDRRHDGLARVAIDRSRDMLVPWYLIASWAYYVCDHPLLTDPFFDGLCRALAAELPAIAHRHKHLVDPEAIAAGTCLLPREAYPATVRGAAAHLAWSADGVRLPRD